MPIPASVAQAAEDYRFNSSFLLNTVKDLTAEEWVKRPGDSGNHIAWLVGHLLWTRKRILARLGAVWSESWLDLFARGVKPDGATEYPSPDTMMDAWSRAGSLLSETLENVSEELLATPVTPPAPPTADGKVSGLIRFMAWHETYHLGQICYVRSLLGHKGMMG
jgi:uncharacterized damage-inducible protein DinB